MKNRIIVSVLLGVSVLLLFAIGYHENLKTKPIIIGDGISLNTTLEKHESEAKMKKYYNYFIAKRAQDVLAFMVDVNYTQEFTSKLFSDSGGRGASKHINCILPPKINPKTKKIESQWLLIGIEGDIVYLPSEKFPDWFDYSKYRSFLNVASIPYLDDLLYDLKERYGEPDRVDKIKYLSDIPYLRGGGVGHISSSEMYNENFSYLPSLNESHGMIYVWKKHFYTIKYFSGYRYFPNLINIPRIIYSKDLYRLTFLVNTRANIEDPVGYELGYYPQLYFELNN